MPADLTGKRFGRLVALYRKSKPKRPIKWICKCDCGTTKPVSAYCLMNGDTQSCGCLRREILRKLKTTHGHACRGRRSAEFKTWNEIKKRSLCQTYRRYKDYGGRGITICNEWLGTNGFLSFYADMGPRPSKNHSIDRIENDKGYYKENCRWALDTVQNINQRIRRDNKSGVKGVSFCNTHKRYQARISVFGKTRSLGSFKNLEDAIAARKLAEEKYHKPILDAA